MMMRLEKIQRKCWVKRFLFLVLNQCTLPFLHSYVKRRLFVNLGLDIVCFLVRIYGFLFTRSQLHYANALR